jgi:hypothetical protein
MVPPAVQACKKALLHLRDAALKERNTEKKGAADTNNNKKSPILDNPDLTFLLKTPTIWSDGSFFWRMDIRTFFPLIEGDAGALELYEVHYDHVVGEAQQVL